MTAFAMFRLPYAGSYTTVEQLGGEPEELSSVAMLDGRSGFVVAPFSPCAAEPVLLLRPDRVEVRPVGAVGAAPGRLSRPVSVEAAERTLYAESFARCHALLADGTLSKVVLARMAAETMARGVAPRDLFVRACHLFPRMFVALVSARRCGTWLVATPETLLSGSGGQWRTVALAGTMKLEGAALGFDSPPQPAGSVAEGISWSRKDREEQRLVADYIEATLAPFALRVGRQEAKTVRAGGVVHLRSDFAFTLKSAARLGGLLDALHPTPAVCGLPKGLAAALIRSAEHTPRSYYSGFMGPLSPVGDTSLYVSLRCMRIDGLRCSLYAGGGLLAGSREGQEWAETEAKLEAMRSVLGDILAG